MFFVVSCQSHGGTPSCCSVLESHGDTVPGVMEAADALVLLMSEGGSLLREREERKVSWN